VERRPEVEDQPPQGQTSGFEPPRLTVIGTVKELTQGPGKVGPAFDGVNMTGPSNL